MKKLYLILGLTFWVSVAQANLGDTANQNFWRHNTEPIKMIMMSDDPNLQLRLLVYSEYGSFYVVLIGADTVVMESVICNRNSVEQPESVVMRFKSLYGEGQTWTEVESKQNTNGKQKILDRADHMIGIRMRWWVSAPGRVIIDSFVQIGEKQIVAGLNKVEELNQSGLFIFPKD